MYHICIFDFETDSKKPLSCNPVEVACAMLDPFSLKLVKGSEFCSGIRPYNIDDIDYLTKDRLDTIAWHCRRKGCTQQELLTEWRSYPYEKVVWQQFVSHINIYSKQNSRFHAPVAAGMNIKNFDLIIVDRLNVRYKQIEFFNYEIVDLRDLAFTWLRWDKRLHERSLDSLREYFGIDQGSSHTAMADVYDTSTLISRFLLLQKELFPKMKFKGSLSPTFPTPPTPPTPPQIVRIREGKTEPENRLWDPVTKRYKPAPL